MLSKLFNDRIFQTAAGHAQAYNLPSLRRHSWKGFGINNAYLAVLMSTDQQNEALLADYHRNGYTLQVITNSSPPELIAKLSAIYGLAYFLTQYPQNHSEHSRKAFISSRLQNGDVCLAILYEGEIAHTHWLGFENTWRENRMLLARNLKLDLRTTAYSYNVYTGEPYRSKRLQFFCDFHVFNFLKTRGYPFMFGLIGPRNTASMKTAAKLGKFTGVVIERNLILCKDYVFLPIDFPRFQDQ